MKFISKMLIIILFFCLDARAESLEGLNDFLLSNGAVELIGYLDLENSKQTSLDLENEILKMGGKEAVIPAPKWQLERLSTGIGVQLSLEGGQQYFANNPVATLGLEVCSDSGATSGVAYKTHLNGTSTSFAWSCGSQGCRFRVKLGEGFELCS